MARIRSFDENDVLEKILMFFWKYGSTTFSIDHIAKELELSKTSLYKAYGDKDELVIKCLNLYYVEYDLKMITEFKGESLSEACNSLLEFAKKRFYSKKSPSGCFMINCLLEKSRLSPKLQKHVEKTASLFFDELRDKSEKAFQLNSKTIEFQLKKLSVLLIGLAVNANLGIKITSLDFE